MDFKFVKYSGVDLTSENDLQVRAYKWAHMIDTVTKQYGGVIAMAMKEPWYMDDSAREPEMRSVIENFLNDGELFACFANDQFVGFIGISRVILGREAYLDAYALPQFRKTILLRRIIDRVIKYCWERLGLVKLKAEIAEQNHSSFRACVRLGFGYVGTSPLDGLYLGQPTNMMLLELFNPAYLPTPPEVIHEQEEPHTSDAGGTAVHAWSEPVRPPADDSASHDQPADPVDGHQSGEGQEPDRPVVVDLGEHQPDAKPRSKAKVR